VRHHEEIYLPDPKSTILLVGYQTMGTVGRHLIEGAKKVTIDKKEVQVKAHIESILGFSSHKDSDHLVEFVSMAEKTLKKVFVAMGEPKSSAFLAQRLNNELGIKAVCPERGVGYEIE
ncbi:MAG: MBL fold metallo-hydrolase RNA specificity domain-containing protein, partial [Patescibacteria group bacterium]